MQKRQSLGLFICRTRVYSLIITTSFLEVIILAAIVLLTRFLLELATIIGILVVFSYIPHSIKEYFLLS